MSVLIKGITFPRKPDQITVTFRFNDPAGDFTHTHYIASDEIVEVPTPHGPLVNIDEVYRVLSEQYHHTTDLQHTALREALAKVPTVLEAEGGDTDVNTD